VFSLLCRFLYCNEHFDHPQGIRLRVQICDVHIVVYPGQPTCESYAIQ
jgi:hypothetical protein